MTDYLEILKAARRSEFEIRAELEHIERIHRILKIPDRPLKYVEELTEKLAGLEETLNNNIDDAVDRKREALEILSVLIGDERTVLYRYYILGDDWRQIAEKLYISERQVFNIRKSAMDKLSERYTMNLNLF